MRPPFVPKISSEDDLGNIDKMFTKEPARETPENRSSILKGAKFADFTYVEDNSALALRKSKTITLS